MAGIYIHIPFCKTRCVYCGFYSTTLLQWRQRYVDAVCREMEMRDFHPSLSEEGVRWDTVYLGGGTPSQLTVAQLHQLFDTIHNIYKVEADAEVTMECNPDDVTPDFAEALSRLPVNRVSMGAQTFNDERLHLLHRRHTAGQIPVAVRRLRDAGIRNISIDLMFGFPHETIDDWHDDIEQALALDVEHLSAYSLMYEEGTPLFQLLEQGRISEVDEELSRQMYYDLIDRLTAAGYEHYEISNFARQGYRSRHNSSYWNQTPYLGLGAAAHSYDGRCRRWNVDDIERYMAGMENDHPAFEQEIIDDNTRYNDIVMTALRTCEGLNLGLLTAAQQSYCLQQAQRYLTDGLLVHEKSHLRLSRRGLYVSDMIMSDLMLV